MGRARSALPLLPGDLVALVAPASQVPAAGLAFATTLLSKWGLRIRLGANARSDYGFLAATDDERLKEFQAAWDDPEVRGVFCLRGGYGSQRIVDRIDWRQPGMAKVLVGFSDITALHLALWQASGGYSLHGPCLGASPTGLSLDGSSSLQAALTSGRECAVDMLPSEPTYAISNGEGRVSGPLLGGNLTSVATSLGTPSCPEFSGAIMLLEDVAEFPYRIDRMLTYLGRQGVFERTVAVVLGQFKNCRSRDGHGPSVLDVLSDRMRAFGVPFMGGLPVGHESHAETIRLGQIATLDFDTKRLSMGPVDQNV